MAGWIFGLVGALGFTGAVAAVIAFAVGGPIALQGFMRVAFDVWDRVLDRLKRMWATRTGMAVLVGITVAICVHLYTDHATTARVKAEWATANAVAADRARDADNLAATHAEFTDKRDAAAEVDADAANTEARNAYVADLEKRAAAVCTLSDTDLKRLRDIR